MLVGENYKIESDNLNVTVFEKKVITGTRASKKEVGEVYYYPIAYFSSIPHALDYLADKEVKETDLKDLRTVVEKQKELYQLIRSLKL